MGYIRHDAIVVTGWDAERLKPARAKAVELKLPVSEIVSSPVNGYVSFMIAPDGSKEGWDSSDNGDKARAAWIEWARKTDGLWVDWAHVSYGGDEPRYASLKDHNAKGTE